MHKDGRLGGVQDNVMPNGSACVCVCVCIKDSIFRVFYIVKDSICRLETGPLAC
jgi:hypothetical protein